MARILPVHWRVAVFGVAYQVATSTLFCDALTVVEEGGGRHQKQGSQSQDVQVVLVDPPECPQNFIDAIKNDEVDAVQELTKGDETLKKCHSNFEVQSWLGTEETRKATGSGLLYAAALGLDDMVRGMLADGFDPNDQTSHQSADGTVPGGMSALMMAVAYGRVRVVKKLATFQGTNLDLTDEDGKTALIYAAIIKSGQVFKTIWEKADSALEEMADKDGQTPLMWAVKSSALEIVRILTSFPTTKMDVVDKDGKTALMLAAASDSDKMLDMLKSLLGKKEKIDKNKQDNAKKTALMYAASHNAEAVQELMNEGANLELQDEDGKTALIYAVQGKVTKAVETLVNSGKADCNMMTKDQKTALMVAVSGDSQEIIWAVAKCEKTDLSLADKDGLTAVVLAAESSADSVKAIFRDPANKDLDETQKPVQEAIGNAFLLAAAKGKDKAFSTLMGFNSAKLDLQNEAMVGSVPDGSDTSGSDTPGSDTPGSDTPGSDTPGSDKPGSDTPGSDTPGSDTDGSDTDGSDTAGSDKDDKPKDAKESELNMLEMISVILLAMACAGTARKPKLHIGNVPCCFNGAGSFGPIAMLLLGGVGVFLVGANIIMALVPIILAVLAGLLVVFAPAGKDSASLWSGLCFAMSCLAMISVIVARPSDWFSYVSSVLLIVGFLAEFRHWTGGETGLPPDLPITFIVYGLCIIVFVPVLIIRLLANPAETSITILIASLTAGKLFSMFFEPNDIDDLPADDVELTQMGA